MTISKDAQIWRRFKYLCPFNKYKECHGFDPVEYCNCQYIPMFKETKKKIYTDYTEDYLKLEKMRDGCKCKLEKFLESVTKKKYYHNCPQIRDIRSGAK